MPYKDPNKQRAYMREYQRARSSARVGLTRSSQTLVTIEDLRTVFERITNEVLNDEALDLGIKGRVLAQLLKVGVELIQGSSLERRVSELERRAELSKYA